MMLDLPPTNPTDEQELKQIRFDAQTASILLAHAEFAAAARIIRKLWGDAAAELVVDMLEDDADGNTDISLLVLLDRDGTPLWFNPDSRHDCGDYPGAAQVSDDNGQPRTGMQNAVVAAIEDHLRLGYDACRGYSWSLDRCSDGYFSDVENPLVLDIRDALKPAPKWTKPPLSGC